MLGVEGAVVGYRGQRLLDGSAFSLRPGEMKGFVAPNGYGKTTFMRALSGDYRGLMRGLVVLDDVRMRADFTSDKVFYMPGDASMLHPDLSALDHLRMVKTLWRSDEPIESVARRCGVDSFLRRPVRALSQGMRQQVSMAVTCMSGARYLLLDEPMNALDPINVQRFSDIMRTMLEEGRAILISSHILGSIDALCDRSFFVREGILEEVVHEGGSSELFDGYYAGLR